VTSELVGAAEALGAAWKLTRVWFFASVSANVPSLVL